MKSNQDYYRKYPWMRSFVSARTRCTCKSATSYKRYGGAGIKFLMTAQDFKTLWERDKAHLMTRPTIDRIDTKGHYEISNCRFLELSENVSRAQDKFRRCQEIHPRAPSTPIVRKNGNACRQCAEHYERGRYRSERVKVHKLKPSASTRLECGFEKSGRAVALRSKSWHNVSCKGCLGRKP